jgi:hypothetical protein
MHIIPSFSQEKTEIEKPVKAEILPEAIINLVCSHFKPSRVDYLLDLGENDTTYEAKFRHHDLFYSMEFELNGELRDIEVVIDLEKLNEDQQALIHDALKKKLEKYRITKVQKHWKGSRTKEILQDLSKMKEEEILRIESSYELIVFGRNAEHLGYFEVFFDEKIKMDRQEMITNSNNDNLLY